MSAYQVKPWTQVVTPHQDILDGKLDNSTFGASLGSVVRNDANCAIVYRDAQQFFAATYLTQELKKLLTTVLNGLGGQGGDRILQLRTPFGGGKTHALISLYHLVKHRHELHGLAELDSLPNPGNVNVLTFIGQDFDIATGTTTPEGQTILTPWGLLAWQIGKAATYAQVEQSDQNRIAPGGEVLRNLFGDTPNLILLDEFLLYIEGAMGMAIGDSNFGRQVLAFVQKLTEVVRELPKTVLVYSLQKSTREALGSEGVLETLDQLVNRLDAKKEPVSGDEIMKVVQRRLFQTVGDPQTIHDIARQQAELFRKYQEAYIETERDRQEIDQQTQLLTERIEASYPFHPALLDLMYHRWGSLPSYQRTRGALQFLARVVSALWQQKDNTWLINPGSIPLQDIDVKQAFYSQIGDTQNTHDAVLSADLIGRQAKVKTVNRRLANDAPHLKITDVGSRLAAAIMMYSFGAKQGEDRGALEQEVLAACLADGLDRTTLSSVLKDLRDELLYLHVSGRRYRFETEPNLNKVIADEESKISSHEVLEHIQAALSKVIKGDRGHAVLWPQDSSRINDRVPKFTVVYLDPSWTGKTKDEAVTTATEWLENRGNDKREYKNAICFVLPNYQSMDKARQSSRHYLAIQNLRQEQKKYNLTADKLDELHSKAKNAETSIKAAIERLYDSILLPQRDDASANATTLEDIALQAIRTSDPLQTRVLDALQNYVFDKVTVNKLLRLYQLDTQEAKTITAQQVINGFFQYPTHPKMISAKPIKDAILKAIEDGKLGYCVALTAQSDGTFTLENPDLLISGKTLPADEFDPDGTLLTPALVEQLREQFKPPEETEQPEAGETGSDRGDGKVPVNYPDDPTQPTQPANDQPGKYETKQSPTSTIERHTSMEVVNGKPAKSYRLNVILDKSNVFDIVDILQALSDKAENMTVSLDVRAHTTDQFERQWIQNALEEPLDEAEIKATTYLE